MANHRQAGAKTQVQAPSLHSEQQFENPYNFVPAPPRLIEHATLGDAPPVGHHRYLPGLWSGRISVELTTVTPLLIPDQPIVDATNGHKTFGVRTDEKGAPYLPPTSIKGALRAAYEAVTNSRMGVWSKAHDSRLALRQPAESALGLIPVRIVAKLVAGRALLFATEHEAVPLRFYSIARDDERRGAIEYAERYANIEDGGDTFPQHGDCVQRNSRSGELAWVEEGEPVVAGWRRGYAVINGPNIKNKINERLFLEINRPREFGITPAIKKQWDELMSNYQKLHVLEIEKRRREGQQPADFLGDKPGQTAWSRHIHDSASITLKQGLLCYARVTDKDLAALYPVLISRQLFSTAPSALLDVSLQPASQLSELSPADRLFGWVARRGSGQYKGQLRIGAIQAADGANAIEPVGDAAGVPLTILGAPKPAQARFYGANDKQGTPYPRGTDKAAMYRPEHGLRGRKFYPHHKAQAQAADYWDRSARPPEVSNQSAPRKLYREWRLPENAEKPRTDQNRSITAWVMPGARFRFDLQLTNVSSVELGALLWLLSLGDDCCLRLGGGKPLGFGSVRLRLAEGDGLDLRDGEAMRARYASFGAPTASGQCLRSGADVTALITAYQAALPAAVASSGVRFDRLPVIKAFLNAARGGNLPVHYPRTQVAPNAEGENYKWFVANETWSNSRHERYSLPDLAAPDRERGLWVLK